MSEIAPIERARLAVEQILATLKVARVVFVDDKNSDGCSLEEFLAAAVTLPSERLRQLCPEVGDNIPEDRDVLVHTLRSAWDAMDVEIRVDRAEKILAVVRQQDSGGIDDRGDASILSELIPEAKLLAISPSQWAARSEDLLKDDNEGRSLFLFDQDLTETGGDVQGGMKIIASLLARNDTGNLICGLLTHTVTPENQPERWEELSQEHGIPRDRFLVVPKQYLSKDPMLFALVLKWITLSPDFVSLKEKAKTIIAEATDVAAVQVDKISIYDLDHIVFRVSAAEGLWEPDMLFRLHALFHRMESRRRAHDEGDLEAIAGRLRSVSHIPTQTALRPASSAWLLQHQELYEPGEYLNQNHLPLDIGDIFEKTGTGSSKYFILLAQPCDLRVRGGGKRYPELAHLPIAEIVCPEKTPEYAEEMPYFTRDPGKPWYVKLRQVHQVKAWVLDLCVFSNDGTSVLPITGDPATEIMPSWKARHGILQREVARIAKRVELLSCAQGDSPDTKKTKDGLRSQVSTALLNEGLFKGEIVGEEGCRSISFNCRRTSRLTRARAFALLMAYTGCLTRPAVEREFGCDLPDAGGNGQSG